VPTELLRCTARDGLTLNRMPPRVWNVYCLTTKEAGRSLEGIGAYEHLDAEELKSKDAIPGREARDHPDPPRARRRLRRRRVAVGQEQLLVNRQRDDWRARRGFR
jgi:hypothetical protein